MMLYLAEAMGNAEAKNSVETSRLAAIVFDRDDPIDDVMRSRWRR